MFAISQFYRIIGNRTAFLTGCLRPESSVILTILSSVFMILCDTQEIFNKILVKQVYVSCKYNACVEKIIKPCMKC